MTIRRIAAVCTALAMAARPAVADVRSALDEMAAMGRPLTLRHAQAFALACAAEADRGGCESEVLARMPNWEILLDTDPITDATFVIMRRPARHGDGAIGITCKGGVSWAILDLPGRWRAGPYRAVMRVDSGEPQPWLIWQRDGKLSVDAQPFVADLWRAEQLAVRATDDAGVEVTAVFDVRDLAAESYWLTDACPALRQE